MPKTHLAAGSSNNATKNCHNCNEPLRWCKPTAAAAAAACDVNNEFAVHDWFDETTLELIA